VAVLAGSLVAARSRAAAVDNPGSIFGPTAPDAIPAGKTRRRPTIEPPSAKKKPTRSGATTLSPQLTNL